MVALDKLRHQAQTAQIAVQLKAVILRIAINIGCTCDQGLNLCLHFLAHRQLFCQHCRQRQAQIAKQLLVGLHNFFWSSKAVKVHIGNTIICFHLLCQRQSDIMHDDIDLRCGGAADFVTSAAAWQLYANLYACLLQNCVQLGVGKITHALSQNIDAAVTLLLFHHQTAGRNSTLQAGEMVLALKVLGMHRHHGNIIFFAQLHSNSVVVITNDLNHAGSDQHHALGLIFCHNFGKGLMHAFGAAKGDVVAVQNDRYATAANAAVTVADGEALGVIATLIRAHDNQQAICNAAGHHGGAHQRTVRAWEERRGQLRHVLNRLHPAQPVQMTQNLLAVHALCLRRHTHLFGHPAHFVLLITLHFLHHGHHPAHVRHGDLFALLLLFLDCFNGAFGHPHFFGHLPHCVFL